MTSDATPHTGHAPHSTKRAAPATGKSRLREGFTDVLIVLGLVWLVPAAIVLLGLPLALLLRGLIEIVAWL